MAENKIRVIVEPDTDGFQKDLDRDLERVHGEVKVDADTTMMKTTVQRTVKEMESQDIDIPVDANTTGAKVTVQKFRGTEEADPIDIPVTADVTRARVLLASFTERARVPITKTVNLITTGATNSLNQLGSLSSKVFTRIGASAKQGAVAIVAALGTAAALGKDELLEANKVSTQTTQLLKQTGLAAKVSTADIEALSGALLKKSGIDDQAIQAGANFLLTQKNIQATISKQPAFLKAATEAATNLASSPAFNGNMQAASKALGKALADPEKGMLALKKAGIALTDSEKERVKTLMEAGRVAEAQAIVLGKVDESLGGLAGARGKSVEGQLGRLSEGFAGLGASVLEKTMPALLVIGGALESAFSDTGVITRFFKALSPIGDVLKIIGDTFETAFAGVGGDTDIINEIALAMQKFGLFVQQNQPYILAFALEVKKLVVAIGPLIQQLSRFVLPVLKMLGIAVGLLITGLVIVATNLAQIATKILGWIPSMETVQAKLGEFTAWLVTKWIELKFATMRFVDDVVTFFQLLPGRIMAGIRKLAVQTANFFRGVWEKVKLITVTIVTGYIAFVRAIPGRILAGLAALGQMLWTLATNAWNRFRTAVVTASQNLIAFVRGIPGRITAGLGNLADLLYGKGKDVIQGFFDGLKAVWKKVRDWLSGIGDKIKDLKGPIEVDRGLLVDEGKAVMEGFHEGLQTKWESVADFLGSRGGFIKGLLTGSGVRDAMKLVGDLFTGEVSFGEVAGKLDELALGGMHPSSGLADTTAMANIIAKRFHQTITSILRPGAVTTTGNRSQHADGMAADFSDGYATPNMDALAAWAYTLIGKAFHQVLYRTMTGGNHFNHVHIGWKARAKGGRVQKHDSYMVGEKGPEPFIPERNGFILSNSKFNRILSLNQRVQSLELGEGQNAAMPMGGRQVVQENHWDVKLIHTVPDASSLLAMLTTRLDAFSKASLPSLAGGIQ